MTRIFFDTVHLIHACSYHLEHKTDDISEAAWSYIFDPSRASPVIVVSSSICLAEMLVHVEDHRREEVAAYFQGVVQFHSFSERTGIVASRVAEKQAGTFKPIYQEAHPSGWKHILKADIGILATAKQLGIRDMVIADTKFKKLAEAEGQHVLETPPIEPDLFTGIEDIS